jgi:hypothetical protein
MLLVLSLALPLAACAVPATQITGPDGRPAYVLKCSGMGRDRQDCLVKAGELCPSGYNVVDDNSSTHGAVVVNNAVILAHREYLTISCK